VDLILKTNGKTTIVQCEGYAASYFVGPATIRELYSTLIDHKSDQAWLVTTTGFIAVRLRLLGINQFAFSPLPKFSKWTIS
jgi:hypothetical protein